MHSTPYVPRYTINLLPRKDDGHAERNLEQRCESNVATTPLAAIPSTIMYTETAMADSRKVNGEL